MRITRLLRPNQPIVIEREALSASLSLEALGLLAHLIGDKTRDELQREFPEYEIDALLAELIDAELIEEVELPADVTPERDREPNIWVYVVQVGSAFKIGVTKSVKRRLKQYKTHAPSEPIVIWSRRFLDAGAVERNLHRKLKRYHSHGEWFHCDRATIDSALDEYGESET